MAVETRVREGVGEGLLEKKIDTFLWILVKYATVRFDRYNLLNSSNLLFDTERKQTIERVMSLSPLLLGNAKALVHFSFNLELSVTYL